MVAISDHVDWTAATWLFDWIMDEVGAATDDPGLAAALREIVDNNIGFLSIQDLLPTHRAEFIRISKGGLSASANLQFRQDYPGRAQALRCLDEFSSQVAQWWLEDGSRRYAG